MKALKFLTLGAISALLMASCGSNVSSEKLPGFTTGQIDSASYAVGMSLAGMVKQANMQGLNYNEVFRAFADVMNGAELKISEEQVNQVINEYMMQAQAAIGKMKEQEQAEFFAENKTKDSVQTTESGLQYKIVAEGNNEIMATAADTVEVHYTGRLLDGTVFDSSVERGEAAKFPLAHVIPGWTEGMQLVGEGGKITLWIPFNLGYGPRAMGPELPAYSTLVFDVELIKVYKAANDEKK